MRVADAHILVSERSHALGRYYRDDKLFWFHASMADMVTPLPGAAAIEFLTYEEAESVHCDIFVQLSYLVILCIDL